MIYVCEYDDQADDRRLQERGRALLLPFLEEFPDGSERRRRKLRERILSRLLLDFALKREYGCSLTELDIVPGPGGKPESRLRPEIRFNLSHCDTACACMVGTCEAGIDVERKFSYRENLAHRVCSTGEWSVFAKLEADARREQLHFLWSLKESYVKWNGRGLVYGMQRIDLSEYLPLVLQPGESRILDGTGQKGRQEEAHRHGAGDSERTEVPGFWIRNEESYTVAVCCREIPVEAPYYIEEEKLLEAGGEEGTIV